MTEWPSAVYNSWHLNIVLKRSGGTHTDTHTDIKLSKGAETLWVDE